MKRSYITLLIAFLCFNTFAQAPQGFNYQGIARDSKGKELTTKNISLQLSILMTATTGTIVYTETHSITTNDYGLFTVKVGGGKLISGDFSKINWTAGLYYLKVEMDPAGGTAFTFLGTSQLISVPYALMSNVAIKSMNDLDTSATNELQIIKLSNDTMYLDRGGFVYLGKFDDKNAIQQIKTKLNTDSLNFISKINNKQDKLKAGSGISIDSLNVIKAIETNDTNELQKLSIHNDTIFLTNGGFVKLPAGVDYLKLQIKTLEDLLIATGTYKIFDMDGNQYNVVKIGNQVWMKQNLKTTTYCNGDTIPNITNTSIFWGGLTTGAYCNYNNDTANATTYGRLYNWLTVNDNRKICPVGWHVPTDAEWTTLENYLMANGYNYDNIITGNKYAKALASATGWATNTVIGTVGNTDYPVKRNITGFTALPAGFRDINGDFSFIGNNGYWWSSTASTSSNAYYREISYNASSVARYDFLVPAGFSIRCLRDY